MEEANSMKFIGKKGRNFDFSLLRAFSEPLKGAVLQESQTSEITKIHWEKLNRQSSIGKNK